MLRRVIAIFTGFVVGGVVVAIVEGISSILHPFPESLDVSNIEQMQAFVGTLPMSAFLLVLLAHCLGAFTAGLVVSFIVKEKWVAGASGLGILFLLAGIVNLIVIPHPLWFGIIDLIIYLPAALLGANCAGFLLSSVGWVKLA